MINKVINKYRKRIALYNLIKDISITISVFLIIINIFSILENIFYLNETNREKIFYIVLSITITLLIYSV